jgi:hypothetical protein
MCSIHISPAKTKDLNHHRRGRRHAQRSQVCSAAARRDAPAGCTGSYPENAEVNFLNACELNGGVEWRCECGLSAVESHISWAQYEADESAMRVNGGVLPDDVRGGGRWLLIIVLRPLVRSPASRCSDTPTRIRPGRCRRTATTTPDKVPNTSRGRAAR